MHPITILRLCLVFSHPLLLLYSVFLPSHPNLFQAQIWFIYLWSRSCKCCHLPACFKTVSVRCSLSTGNVPLSVFSIFTFLCFLHNPHIPLLRATLHTCARRGVDIPSSFFRKKRRPLVVFTYGLSYLPCRSDKTFLPFLQILYFSLASVLCLPKFFCPIPVVYLSLTGFVVWLVTGWLPLFSRNSKFINTVLFLRLFTLPSFFAPGFYATCVVHMRFRSVYLPGVIFLTLQR